MKIEQINIAELQEYKNNAKLHPKEQIDQIIRSIEEFGFNDPIAIDENNVLIEGHGRLIALKRLNYKEVDVIRLNHLTESQKKAYILAHNKLTMNTGFDEDLLQMELESLEDDFDMADFGFDDLDFEEPNTEEDDYEFPEDNKIETDIKYGDVYQIGQHRLMCGDSTKKEDVERLMDGEKADMVFTDPPYNVNYEGGNGLKIKNDNMKDSEFYKFLLSAYSNYSEALRAGGCIYVAHADTEGANFRSAFVDSGLLLKQCLMWVKQSAPLSRQDYNWKHEPILYGWKKGSAHYFCKNFTLTTVIDDSFNYKQAKKEDLLKYIEEMHEKISTSVIREDRPTKSKEHPTMKPIKLVGRFIKNSSIKEQLIADFFLGSGSTMVASHKLNRKCYGMELDPKYCQVILDRMKKLDPELEVKKVN